MGQLIAVWIVVATGFFVAARSLKLVRLRTPSTAIVAGGIYGLLNALLGTALRWVLDVVLVLPAFLTFGLAYLLAPVLVSLALLAATDAYLKEDFQVKGVAAYVKLAVGLAVAQSIVRLAFTA